MKKKIVRQLLLRSIINGKTAITRNNNFLVELSDKKTIFFGNNCNRV